MHYTILIVQFDLSKGPPPCAHTYPAAATFLGRYSEAARCADEFDDLDEAAERAAAANASYLALVPLMQAGVLVPQWAIVAPVDKAEIIMAYPKGQWFSLEMPDEIICQNDGMMEGKEYHPKPSFN